MAFLSSKDMSDYVMSRKASTEVQRGGDVQIVCGDLKLVFPRVCGNAPSFDDEEIEEIGRIECRTKEDVIIIGVLVR